MEEEIRAKLVIYDMDVLTEEEKKLLVKWLKSKIADVINKKGDEYAKKYTSRLFK